MLVSWVVVVQSPITGFCCLGLFRTWKYQQYTSILCAFLLQEPLGREFPSSISVALEWVHHGRDARNAAHQAQECIDCSLQLKMVVTK